METTTINTKLLAFQKKVNAIKKDAVNPHFGKPYATLPQILAEVKPVLSEIGLILLQPITDGKVETTIICGETGEKVSSDMTLPLNLSPQQIGSAITYYRRYLLAGLLSLEIEDDDANEAQKGSESGNGNSQGATGTANHEPTEWLNLFTKDGAQTETFNKIKQNVDGGNIPSLADIRKKYKVSKKTAEELKSNFNIE